MFIKGFGCPTYPRLPRLREVAAFLSTLTLLSLLGVDPQPTDSRLSETTPYPAASIYS